MDAPEDWRYKGEGASNVVLDYHGSDPQLLGTVLRIRKARSRSRSDANGDGDGCEPALSDLERNLWKDWPAVACSRNEEELRHAYVRDVMRPLLGDEYVDSGRIVPVSIGFLENLSRQIRPKRPAWRADEADLDFSSDKVLVVCDHTLFSGMTAKESKSPTLSVEVKPKWGYLPQSDAIATQNNVKKVVSRFTMHQRLKFAQGRLQSTSSYCPLDLFSGKRERIIAALTALFKDPQNNLRVFVDGNRIFTGSLDNTQDSTDNNHSRDILEKSLAGFTTVDAGQRVAALENLVSEILHSTDALKSLLKAQLLDSLDVEGIIHVFYTFVGLPCLACESSRRSIDPDVVSAFHCMQVEEQRRYLAEFLIAATAKDCSLMVTLTPHLDPDSDSDSAAGNLISCPATGRSYRYKISFLDLDLKRLDKIPYYFRLDQTIVEFFLEQSERAY